MKNVSFQKLLSLLIVVSMLLSALNLPLKSSAAVDEITPMVSVGSTHTLALKSDGTVWGWGSSEKGQLAQSARLTYPDPVQIEFTERIKFIEAGNLTSFAITESGNLYAWGLRHRGVLGIGGSAAQNGVNDYQTTPKKVQLDQPAIAVGAGAGHTVALLQDGHVLSWGLGNYGQLGNSISSESNYRYEPGYVFANASASEKLANIMAIAAGPNHTLALASDYTVWSWGDSALGKCGHGAYTANTPYKFAKKIEDLVGIEVRSVFAGDYHSGVLTNFGEVYTFGRNSNGQLGHSFANSNYVPLPTKIPDINNIQNVQLGGDFTAIEKNDGLVYFIGENYEGVFGSTDRTNRNSETHEFEVIDTSRMQLSSDLRVNSISASYRNIAYSLSDGTVWMCGYNEDSKVGAGGSSPYVDYLSKVAGLRLFEANTDVYNLEFKIGQGEYGSPKGDWLGGGPYIQRIEVGETAVQPLIEGARMEGSSLKWIFSHWDKDSSSITDSPDGLPVIIEAVFSAPDTTLEFLTESPLPNAKLGEYYEQLIDIKIGVDNINVVVYVFDLDEDWNEIDKLPPGISFDQNTHTLAGTPIEVGLFEFTLNIYTEENAISKVYSLTVKEDDGSEEPTDITINYAATLGGSVNPNSEILNPVTGIAVGSTATAEAGYHFVNWTDSDGNVVSTDAHFIPAKVDGLNLAATYTANFVEIPHVLIKYFTEKKE